MERLRQIWSTKSAARRRMVLDAALDLAREKGWRDFTQAEVAERAGIAKGSVTHAFATMNRLRGEVMRAAIERQVLPVLAQGLAAHDPVALSAPHGLRKLASQTIVQ